MLKGARVFVCKAGSFLPLPQQDVGKEARSLLTRVYFKKPEHLFVSLLPFPTCSCHFLLKTTNKWGTGLITLQKHGGQSDGLNERGPQQEGRGIHKRDKHPGYKGAALCTSHSSCTLRYMHFDLQENSNRPFTASSGRSSVCVLTYQF